MSDLSDRSHLPLEPAEFGELPEIPLIRGHDADAAPSGTHRDQSIVREPTLSDLFVAVFSGEAGQHFARLSPVTEIRHQDSFRPAEISLQSFHRITRSFAGARVELFEHNRTQPHDRTRVQPSNG